MSDRLIQQPPGERFLIRLPFFKTIKPELIWRMAWETRRQAEAAFF